MKLLGEFWHGNIEPTEYDIFYKEYEKPLELICINEEKLKATMADEQKELFDKDTDFLIFQNGFKLGAGIMFESTEE